MKGEENFCGECVGLDMSFDEFRDLFKAGLKGEDQNFSFFERDKKVQVKFVFVTREEL